MVARVQGREAAAAPGLGADVRGNEEEALYLKTTRTEAQDVAPAVYIL